MQRPAPTRQKKRWANFRHVNGVAVYQEHAEESGEQGAFMVSAVVRSSPKACFQVARDSFASRIRNMKARKETIDPVGNLYREG